MTDHLSYFKSAAAQGKLAHAYLFSGNDKKGKERLIEELISFLLEFRKAAVLANVFEVSPEHSEITIGQIRKLKEQLSLSAWNSPYKIGIIRQAESMNQEAQSAFLKLLEEPRGNTLLMLVVQHPALLLDTIRSRAQELKMYRFEESKDRKAGLLLKLQNSSLAERFSFAEQESQDSKALRQTLFGLQQEARALFLEELRKGKSPSVKLLRAFQEVLLALSQTKVNERYATERILLEL